MSIDCDPRPGDVAGLEGLAPGSALVEALESMDPTSLEGPESVDYLRGWARARNHAVAQFLTAMHEAGRAQDGTAARLGTVDEFSGDEVSTALGWSLSMSGRWLSFADDLHRRLVEVLAAMVSGDLDEPKARVFSEWTRDLDDDHAHQVCAELLPVAPGLPVGALIARLQQVAGALDPEWAARRERTAEKRIRVVASRNPSGTANVSGCDLPMTSGVAIMARVDALAVLVRRGGVARRMAWIRGRVFERLLDGFAAGSTDDELVPLLIADLGAEPGEDDDERGLGGGGWSPDRGPDRGPGGGGGGGSPRAPGDGPGDGPDATGSSADERADESADDEPAAARAKDEDGNAGSDLDNDGPGDDGPGDHTPGDRGADDRGADDVDPPVGDSGDEDYRRELITVPVPRAGVVREGIVEVRLRLSTALGLDDLPAEIPGWGTVLAATARELLKGHRHSEWRVVLTDDVGRLRRVLLPRRRPRAPERPSGPDRPEGRRGRGSSAIVELAAPATLLVALTPDDHGSWAGLLHELQHRLRGSVDGPPDETASAAQALRRHPRAEIDRWVRVRDRQCVAPGCRRPAYASDLDHTIDHARGGPSLSWNCGVWCRHHHRTKHEGGWRVTQPSPGRFRILTRAGARRVVEPPRILEPLPEPRPADHPRPLPAHELTDLADDDEPETLAPAHEPSTTATHRAEALIDPPPPF